MPSERVQRQIDRLLDEAEQAMAERQWDRVSQIAREVLALDEANADAATFVRAAANMLSEGTGDRELGTEGGAQREDVSPLPAGEGQGEGETQASAQVRAGETPALRPSSPSPHRGGDRGEVTPSSFANGRYQVKKFLGEGGKKRVYLAHDTLLDRDVAFALIKTDGLDHVARERVAREAQAMGRLGTHPHIVTVFDLGVEAVGNRQSAVGGGDPLSLASSSPLPMGEGQGEGGEGETRAGADAQALGRGTPYMVTELMGGGDVEGVIEKAPDHKLPLAQALSIAEQVCQGLEFAHAKGIVHRDLKPGNVWLTAPLRGAGAVGSGQSAVGASPLSLAGEGQGEGETRAGADAQAAPQQGVAKIGDFGLAVAIDRTRLTQAGMMVGTVAYMPPEQATGGEVTPRSDLYSLGAMLYEMVTGRPPFVGDEAVAIIGQHLNTPPVAPTWHRPDCPPGLEALILRLLEKDPSKRPASAGEVRAALGHLIPGPFPAGEGERRGSLSLAGEGEGEGEGQAPDGTRALADNPLYRRVFVGREHEIRQLQAAFEAALSGKGALALVVGEPGIGKTAVCEQLATYATLRGGITLTGHCYEEGSLSLPYLAFVEALRGYVSARPPEALRQELGSAATDLARIVSEVRERLAVEPRPPGDPEEDRWRLLQAVTAFLRNASTVQPLLLVLEDLHWADQGTLDLLLHVARNLQGARLLLVGTYRDVEVDRSHPLSATLAELRRGAEFSRVLLRGLGTPEVQRMLQAITGGAVPGSLAESIHRQTEGNPLFVQEVVRFLVEEGHLRAISGQPSAGSSQPSGPTASPSPGSLERGPGGEATAAAMSIPEGLRDVIGRRLSRLSPDCNRLLAIAAVIGRDFALDTLQTVSELEEEPLLSALERALHIGVLEEQLRPGSIRYRFAHAFFRQTLYEELIAPRRLRLHQQVAAALETQYKNRLEEHASELAEHFAQSTDRDDLAKAVRYGELAAQRATAVYAYGEAARNLEQALAVQEVLDPDDKTKRCDLLLALGEGLVSLGQSTRAWRQVAPEALQLAEGIGDRRRASRACRIVFRVVSTSSLLLRSPEVQAWAHSADRVADEGTVDRIYADAFMERVVSVLGDSAGSLALGRRAVHLASRLNEPVALLECSLLLINGGAATPEDQDERLSLAEKLFKYDLAEAESARLAQAYLYMGQAFLSWGRREEAELQWGRAKDAAMRSRDATMAFIPLQIDALVSTLDGDFQKALELGARVRALGVELDREQVGGQTGPRAARRALIYLGKADEALRGIPDSPELFTNRGVFAGQHALCLAHAGQATGAIDILRRMLAARDMSLKGDPTPATVLRYLLEAALVLGDVDAVRILAARMAPLAGLLHTEADMCYNIGRLLGGAAALLGETDKARGYYQQAIEVCEKVRFRPEIALTRLELAELLLGAVGSGQSAVGSSPSTTTADSPASGASGPPTALARASALAHLDFAIAEFREMKMQPSLERALRHKEVLRA